MNGFSIYEVAGNIEMKRLRKAVAYLESHRQTKSVEKKAEANKSNSIKQ